MFITKKMYKELVKSRDEWQDLAIRIHEDNKGIIDTSGEILLIAEKVNENNMELVARCKCLESELEKLKTPCDLCKFSPPTSGDGNSCSLCPAQAKMKDGAE